MQMTIHFMTTTGGIHGEGSQREMLLINLGYGQQGIMRLILLLILYASISDFDHTASFLQRFVFVQDYDLIS
jgi:hypothetical protein